MRNERPAHRRASIAPDERPEPETNALPHAFLKTVFTWTPDWGVRWPERRLAFVPVAPGMEPELIKAMADVMSVSVDAIDLSDLETESAASAARRRIGEARENFLADPILWEVGVNAHGAIVGFHMPILFREGGRDGRPEGTIFYIGVVPAMRGRGHGVELLARTTETLERAGVWRVFTDTAEVNEPMKRAFRSVGYLEGATRDVPIRRETR